MGSRARIETEGTRGDLVQSFLREQRKETGMALVIVVGLAVGLVLGVMLILAYPGAVR
jgi:tetrahydromethanopterin S-methyltransferase subunit F